MSFYSIAGTVVDYTPGCGMMERKTEKYRIPKDGAIPEITISFREGFLESKQKEYPHLDRERCEYLYAGIQFYEKLIRLRRGFMIHASAVEADGGAYLFSAPSGTGKSTHAGLWIRYLGADRARIINDDKPAVCLEEGNCFVYGTPFSGKTDLNENRRAPLRGVAILCRGKNRIQRLSPSQALYPLLDQMVRPRREEDMDKLLTMLDFTLAHVPVYRLWAENSLKAAQVAYEGMKGEIGT